MRRLASVAMATVAIAGSFLVVSNEAGAQAICAPASRVSADPSPAGSDALSRVVTLHGRAVSLRDALDRLAAAARVRFSYAADLLDLSRPVCLEYQSATARQVLRDLLEGVPVRPIILGADQVVLTPYVETTPSVTAAQPQMQRIGLLDRVVVTGSTVGASQRALPIALDVVAGSELSQRGASSLSGALDGLVPGLWVWEQSPLSMLARYGSIRGASSFGVSYPKVYVDGIEVANSLLVTHLDPQSVSRVEVIRGPQGAALYGADAISGVMNIVTRQEGTEGGAPRADLRSEAGGAASDYRSSNVLTQSHAASIRAGNGVRSARLGVTLSSIGPYIPGASSEQLTANGGVRYVISRGLVTGTMRFFAQNARTPSSPVLAGIDFGSTTALQAYRQLRQMQMSPGPGPGKEPDSVRHRLDSLSRLVVLDSTDHQSVRQFTLGASGTFAQNDIWTHSAVIGLDGYRLRSASILDGAFPSALDSALRAATGNAARTTLRLSSVGQFGNIEKAALTVTVAAEHSYVRDRTVTQNQFAPQSIMGSSPAELVETRTNAGVIGQVAASYKEAFFINGGLRIERNTRLLGISSTAALPMIGASAVKSFGPATIKLRAAYGKGIRPPQTSSRAGLLMGITGNISPEEQSGIEAGGDLFVGRFLSLHATRFDQTASGLIQPVSIYIASAADTLPHYRRIVYQLQNVGEISNRGWELQSQLTNGAWSIGAMFSQVDSRVRNLAAGYSGDMMRGDRTLEVPARTFGVNTGYSKGRLSMSWRVSRASDWINYDRIALLTAFAAMDRDPRDFVGQNLRQYWTKYDGVTRVGGRLGFTFAKGLSLSVDGENLLNEQRGEPDNITVLPGRIISAGLGLRF
jgi:iron complex outermembrane receptor protein